MSILADSLFEAYKWLTPYEMVLCAIDLFLLGWYAFPARRPYRWVDFVPSAGVLVSALSLLCGDTTLPALILYGLSGLLFLLTAKRIWAPKRHAPLPKRKRLRAIVRAASCLAALSPIVLALLLAGELRYNPASDFRELSYSEAFVRLNERLSREYPFGDRKKVDWEALERKYTPIFQEAERKLDKELYYKALREYLFSFRDGHVKIVNEALYEDNPVFKRESGGGFGISAVLLDNGQVRVGLLLKGSPAERSGMALGDEIVDWNGRPALDAYRSAAWSENPTATDGDRRMNQGRFMTRSAVGSWVEVEYRSRANNELRKATLKAYEDDYATLKVTKAKLKRTDAPIEGRVLDNGYGYIQIRYFLPNDAVPDPAGFFAGIVNDFQNRSVKGLIVDVRDNPGGDDDVTAAIAGYLSAWKRHYESVSYYSRTTGQFEVNAGETRIITPKESGYKGKVAILVNHNTASSAEGLPLVLKGQPRTVIVGFTSTNGSFGVMSRPIEAKMPEDYLLRFPDGRSLDAHYAVQGDSDGQGRGGALPDIQVPLNEETFAAKYIEGQDVELQAAIEALEKMSFAK
ncbi:carboxyl-terminal processing protease [Fontibacillus solani]|uniref:Carboxyl-terminal processing protease n=1 Tax=Fontibacillus solani TaxID=1572857 RepID=A0A7W3XRV7_9BACL|nr:S41 family peptidase [Fontibacillus solani]MBA9085953.1 carboxyl-terminal processing protease [Fontibacillus solani]